MSTTARKQAPRLARPAARYWKGKAPKGVDAAALNADSDEDEEEAQAPQEPSDVALSGEVAFEGDDDDEDDGQLARGAVAPKRGMNVTLRDVNISKDGKVIVAGREESGKTEVEAGASDIRAMAERAHAGQAEDESSEDEELRPQAGAEGLEDEVC
jgi:microfibrillar-associated protein 1